MCVENRSTHYQIHQQPPFNASKFFHSCAANSGLTGCYQSSSSLIFFVDCVFSWTSELHSCVGRWGESVAITVQIWINLTFPLDGQ